MTRTSRKLERPIHITESVTEIDGDTEDDEGDIYELRSCTDCERMLPLDKPGHEVIIQGTKSVVCDRCFEYWEIFGDEDTGET